MDPPDPPRAALRLRDSRVPGELLAIAWEVFSVVLFVSAVVPAALTTPWPALLFFATLALSAWLAPRLIAMGGRGLVVAGLLRGLAWPLSISPLLGSTGPKILVATVAFGVMAGGMRRAIYRRWLDAPMRGGPGEGTPSEPPEAGEVAASLRSRLAEPAMAAGIAGGHVMMLFSVAFLRTQSHVLFQAWFEIVPMLAVLATVGFTLTVQPLTRAVLSALAAGPGGGRALHAAGLSQALALPDRLALLNGLLWIACTAIGVLTVHPRGASWGPVDALMQLGFGALFGVGVSVYQRGWHRDAVEPAVQLLRAWSGIDTSAEPVPLRHRMLLAFGLPLLFTTTISLYSAIGLYRALGPDLPLVEDVNAILALTTSFAMLVIAGLGIVARAARELSRPMSQLARAADHVAHGRLDAPVPRVAGPVEVVVLGESIERMREHLARTIAELERERAGLEANVEARTAELRRALEELKHAQAALVQNERMASIGELLSGVAHEIYNPLNAIAGAAAPLERLAREMDTALSAYREAEADLPEPRRQTMRELRERLDLDASLEDLVGISALVRRAIDRSVRIVTNLKSFSRAPGEAVPADLHAGIDETLMLLLPRLRHAGIEVVQRYGELPQVVCRAGELNQVFMNLLTNAMQSLEAAPLEDGRRTVRIETWQKDGYACVAVEDTGPGVPPGLEQRIFDPFFTTKPRGQGTGLGLSISADIARRHGGSLALEPAAGGGARFVCRIPVERPAGARARPSSPSEPAPQTIPAR